MGLFDKFKKKTVSDNKVAAPDRTVPVLDRKAIEPFGQPALHLSQDGAAYDFCKFGGPPTVPKAFEWPAWNGKSLAFLLQLRLSDINGDGYLPDLPTSGLLYAFYDEEQSTWGFDPNDKGSWRLMFFEETDELKTRRYPKDLNTRYKERYVCAKPIVTYPPGMPVDDEALEDQYYDFRTSVYGDEPFHHLGGYVDPIQSEDMDLDCQLASNGLFCGDETGYNDERAKELEAGREEWVLLLEIDSDDDVDMMWGDGGTLYFWIRKSDLKAKNFDDVWMILQCC